MPGNRVRAVLRDTARVATTIEAERLKLEAALADRLTAYWRGQDPAEVREYTKEWYREYSRSRSREENIVKSRAQVNVLPPFLAQPPSSEEPGFITRPESQAAGYPPLALESLPLSVFHDCWCEFARSLFNSIVQPLLSLPELDRDTAGTLDLAGEHVALVVFGADQKTVGKCLTKLGDVEREVSGWRIKQAKGGAFISLTDARRLVGLEGAYDRLLKQTIYSVFTAEEAHAQYHGYLLYLVDVENSIKNTLAVERKRWIARPSNRGRVEAFLRRAADVAQARITRKMLWAYAGYGSKHDLYHFEANDIHCGDPARQTFERILTLNPSVFVADLRARELL